ncbi:ParB/RepB/Spo0J family partition protein [Acidiferrimicrobium sp. IK]|uniref:ParB/RepB/Spo0J family partition protein n=1 Tax=Acidiferrimicrobium sp. IK TaxID=2871700 RepID=UPI0021CAEB08|nr:ParB/RepB/Spo0J family partition protein [Acidiferrimicrobium sp. IK]MCU4183999.1 ParB/RepB/Spo0J family partition protein [Acidiferrimicrobium sp. IK]
MSAVEILDSTLDRPLPNLGHDGDQGTCDPSILRPASDNPRRQLGDLAGLRQSVEAQGIIEPLVVTPDGLIVAGHRRHAVAVELELDDVPIIVRDLDDAGRVEAMIAENIVREGLTPLEEAAGYQRLVELGRSQRQLAAQFDVSQGHVSKRLALLKLPEPARAAVDSGGITLEQGLAVAKLPDERIASLFRGGQVPAGWLIDQAVEDQRVIGRRAKAAADLEAAGVRVLPHNPRPMTWLPVVGSPRYGEPVFLSAIPWIDPKEHADEPCHAGYVHHVGTGSSVSLVCTDIARHPQPATDEPVGPADCTRPEPAGDDVTMQVDDRRARLDALHARRSERDSFVQHLIHEMAVPLEEIIHLAVAVLPAVSDYGDGRAMAHVGLDERETYPASYSLWHRYTQDGSANQARALLAIAASGAEDLMPRGDYPTDDPEILVCRAWLGFLAEHGWELDDTEQALLERRTDAETQQADEAPVAAPEVTIVRPPRTKTWKVTCSECGEVASKQTTEAFASERRTAHLQEVHGIPDDRQTQLQGGGSE